MDNKNHKEKHSHVGLGELIKREISARRTTRGALMMDIAVFLVAFFFSRTHIAFGAYPLGIVLVSTLNRRVLIAALGALVGALSLGSVGVIYAVLIPLTVCLRLILGGTPTGALFAESYIVRVACAAVASALGGLYEMILGGFSFTSVLFAAAGVLLSVAISLSFFGLFTSKLTYSNILYDGKGVFAKKREGADKIDVWLFQGSALLMIFFISLSLIPYSFFGISPSYVFVGASALFVAARFGGIRAMACGFIGGFAHSALGAVGFALAGLAAGALFTVGIGYALVGGGVALSVWCAYSGGITGFLSAFPEYGLSALLMLPPLKNVLREIEEGEANEDTSRAARLVNAAAMRYADREGNIEESLLHIAGAMRTFSEGEEGLDFSEYRNIIIGLTAGLNPIPCEENIDALASKLYKRSRVSADDTARLLGEGARPLHHELMRLVGEYERECYMSARTEGVIGEYEHISRMLAHDRYKRGRDSELDRELTERLTDTFVRHGFSGGAVKALGRRRKCVIAAGEGDSEGDISSPELKRALSECVGSPLSDFEYYKKDKTLLLKCFSTPKYSVEYAVAQDASERTGISGDTASVFEEDGAFYSIISDGMGSGEVARKTSAFVADYLRYTLVPDTPSVKEAISSLSGLLRGRREECAATADVFCFDLYTGECRFTKCGAAPSYIKRRESVFAVRSHTSPIGLMKNTDADETCAEVGVGDTVVMVSDGISENPEDAAWLIEFLSRPSSAPAEAYAERILELARERGGTSDDLTVTVIRVYPRDEEICA